MSKLKALQEYIKACKGVIPTQLGNVKIQKIIGQGGNGIVYSGSIFNSNIALKFLVADSTGESQNRKAERFIAEYFNIINLKNVDGIVRYINYEEIAIKDNNKDVINIPVILMQEYDYSLAKKGVVKDENEFIKIINFLLKTVEKIHSYGIIHRDLKPENILVKGEELVITDFGIASYNPNIFSCKAETVKEERLGNRLFSAPEQENSNITAHVSMDIYAIGQIMHWLVFEETHRGTNRKTISSKFPKLKVYDNIIEKCLAHDSEKRYASIEDIESYINSTKISKKNKRDRWDYIELFAKILRNNFPKNEHGIIHCKQIKRIDGLLAALQEQEMFFEDYLWFNGYGNNPIRFTKKDSGLWKINIMEIDIEEIWIHYDDFMYNDFIIVHYKKGKPFIIDGKESYHNIIVDNTYSISYSEYLNNKAEINDEIIDLSNHKVEIIDRFEDSGFLIIATKFHCALQQENDILVEDFMQQLKNNENEININEIMQFQYKLLKHKDRDVILYS